MADGPTTRASEPKLVAAFSVDCGDHEMAR